MLGSTYITTFVSIKLSNLQISEFIIGLVHTAYSVGFIIGTVKTEAFIEKMGHIRSYIAFGIIFTFCTIGNKYFPSIEGWVLFRLLSGICLAGLYVILESYYLLVSPNEKRGQVLAIYMIALYVSQSVSQFFYDIIPFESELLFWILGCLIFSSCFPMIRLKNPEQQNSAVKLTSVMKNPHLSYLGLHASFASGVILTALYSFLPILAQKLELSVSVAMSLMILGGLSFQWPVGVLSDRIDRKKLLFAICLLTFIPCIIPFFFSVNSFFSYCLVTLLGGLSFGLYPVAMTLVCEKKPKEQLTALTGLLILIYSVGMIFGPMLTPFFNQLKDPYGLYLEIIVFSSFLALHGLLVLFKKEKKPLQEVSLGEEN
jgi:MFS family permease